MIGRRASVVSSRKGPVRLLGHCCNFASVLLLFLCPVILIETTDAGYSGYNLNYKGGLNEPPNFDFVTKKQEKFSQLNFNSIPSTSFPTPSGPTTTPASSLNSLDSENSEKFTESNKAEESNSAVDSNRNLNSDFKNPENPVQKIEEAIQGERDENENDFSRVSRRVSGLQGNGSPPLRMLQNQYPQHGGPGNDLDTAGATTTTNFKGWNVIDDDERGGSEPVWSGPGSGSGSGPNSYGGSQSRRPNMLPVQNRVKNAPLPIGPDGKTIGPLPSLPSLDIVEDPGYDHGPRPKWPLNEYLVDKFNSFYRPQYYEKSLNKTENNGHLKHHQQLNHQGYEWQQLQPNQRPNPHRYRQQQQQQQPHFGSAASESHHNYYDSTKFYHLDDDNYFGNQVQDQTRHWNNDNQYSNLYGNHGQGVRGYNSHHREHQSGTNGHETTVSTTADVGKGIGIASGNGGAGDASTSSRDIVKHGPANGPYGHAHYFPPDYYPKKRFRLQIHPGYIAAPIAGLAAFGAASALTKKPLLFELGLVNNKHHYPKPLHYPGGGGGYGHGPGLGWSSNLVPNYYPVNSPIIPNPGSIPPGPTFPVIKPEASHHHKPNVHSHLHSHSHHHNYGWGQQQTQNGWGQQQSQNHHQHQHQNNHHHEHGHGHGHHGHHHGNHHHHHQTNTNEGWAPDKKPWWNPFAALTPRD